MVKESNCQSRDYSLDLLRILCMLMIQTLHICTHGKATEVMSMGSVQWYVMEFMYFLSICSVNLFVLISGYFLVNKPLNFKRVFQTVITVWFYSWTSLIITVGFDIGQVTGETLLTAIFPISYRQYWFATSYIVMCLIAPFLNTFLKGMSKKEYKGFLLLMFVLMSLWHDVLPLSNPIGVNNGFSAVWFIFLYCVAGYIRLYGECFRIEGIKCFCVYVGSSLIMLLIFLIIKHIETNISGIREYNISSYFGSYCSVLVLLQTLACFFMFKGKNIKLGILKKVICFFAPLTFGVYLIHDNANTRDYIYMEILKMAELPNGITSVAFVMIKIICCYVMFSVFEYIRKKVFDFLCDKKMVKKVINYIQNILDDKIYNGCS